jgi:hypothetical protein
MKLGPRPNGRPWTPAEDAQLLWSQDVSEDVARELRRRCDLIDKDLPSSIEAFVESYIGPANLPEFNGAVHDGSASQ